MRNKSAILHDWEYLKEFVDSENWKEDYFYFPAEGYYIIKERYEKMREYKVTTQDESEYSINFIYRNKGDIFSYWTPKFCIKKWRRK